MAAFLTVTAEYDFRQVNSQSKITLLWRNLLDTLNSEDAPFAETDHHGVTVVLTPMGDGTVQASFAGYVQPKGKF